MAEESNAPTRIVVFEENGSGAAKIAGIGEHGRGIEISRVIEVTGALPSLIDEPEVSLPELPDGDLVLDFLNHPDLSDYLVSQYHRRSIPVIALGRRHHDALTPFPCCGLGRHRGLGAYGEQFGFPELEVELEAGRIAGIAVKRGASCGATWQAAARLPGMAVDEAPSTLAREVQYCCLADPSAFDPVSGKSSLHYAGHVHAVALKKAIAEAGAEGR